jgi:hypothetical protein
MRSITGRSRFYLGVWSGICANIGDRYHDENTKEEDLIHPEDIEHFKLHDELEDEADRVAALDKLAIVEQNIPLKFRRD